MSFDVYYGLDNKINPSLGYTKENCQVVCWWYNVSKQTFTNEEVLWLCKRVVSVSETQHAPDAEKMDETLGVIT